MKRYVRERGTSTVQKLLRCDHRAICRLAHAEIASALARRLRESNLDERGYRRAVTRLAADLAALDVVELTASLMEAAEPLLRAFPLRATDALHLAAALRLPADPGVPNEFVCYDVRLRSAAVASGMRVRPAPLKP